MSKPNIDANFGKKSNLDLHPSQLDETTYRQQINGNIESREGNTFMLTNEPSNLLCSRFKEGYKVLRAEPDINSSRTYYFLTNPETGCSEIGYITNKEEAESLEDIEKKCGCNVSKKLSTPLENIEQEALCTYVTLLTDCDCPDPEDPETLLESSKCLNFNVDYPIDVEIKQAKCGTVIYFTDDLNKRRRVEVDKIEQYYFTGEKDCDTYSGSKTCIDCNKLLVQKPFSVPCIDFKGLVSGGAVRQGVYWALIAYCDELGNEVTRYKAMTGKIAVKDPNKNIYQQPELADIVNQSISLTFSGLDSRMKYYKIALVTRADVNGTQSYYSGGMYPTEQSSVIISNLNDQDRVTINKIVQDFPIYTKAKYVESANNMLFFSDLEAQPEINLQPVVNLLGEFALWRTDIAEETIYTDPKYIESHTSYMRDEVVPFSIRFFTNNGYVTANYPLISRQLTSEDLYFDEEHEAAPQETIDEIVESEIAQSGWKKDVASVLFNATNCDAQERYFKWQFYNVVPTLDGVNTSEQLNCQTIESQIVSKTITKECETNVCSEDIIGEVVLTGFEEGEIYTGLINYIKDHQEDLAANGYTHLLRAKYEDGTNKVTCCSDLLLEEGVTADPAPAVVGTRYECDTTGGAFTITLPAAPNNGDIIEISDETSNFATNNLTLGRNGNNIDGSASDYVISTNNAEVKLTFLDGNWIVSETCSTECCDENDLFGGNCDNVALAEETFEFRNLLGEEPETEITYSDLSEYQINKAPDFCQIYQAKLTEEGYEIDEDFITDIFCSGDCHAFINGKSAWEVFVRLQSTGSSNQCNTATDLIRDEEYKIPIHINPYYDPTDPTDADLLWEVGSVYDGLTTTGTGTWQQYLGKNAEWVRIRVSDIIDSGITQILLNMSKSIKASKDDLTYSDNVVRFGFWNDCSGNLFTGQIDYSTGAGASGNFNTGSYILEDFYDGTLFLIDLTGYTGEYIYISMDTSQQSTTCITGTPPADCNAGDTHYYLTGIRRCYALNVYTPTIEEIKVTSEEKLRLRRKCKYTADCDVTVYEEIKCDPIPYAKGRFAAWQSTETYPENCELYDSSKLEIGTTDISTDEIWTGKTFRELFEEKFSDGVDVVTNTYILKNTTDFRGKPIRHFRFPNNDVAPIHDGDSNNGEYPPSFKNSKVFPIGIYLPARIITDLLDLAAKNKLITQDFRNSIIGYEVFRGDTRLDRSIIGKGVIYDMYEYDEVTDKYLFSNFPYNNLGENKLLFADNGQDEFVQHPFDSEGNNKFTFHSPDFSFDKPTIPFELVVEGYLTGNSRGRFADVEDHPNMVLLSRRAYTAARAIAAVEVTLESITEIADKGIQTAQTLFGGLGSISFGSPLAFSLWLGALVPSIATNAIMSGFQKTYEWLTIFDTNGTPYNFASYYTSVGFYNAFNTGTEEGNRVRGLVNRQYLRDGKYTFTEGLTAEEVNINHFKRESAVYLSLGDYNKYGLEHKTSFRNYDNSRFIKSDITCDPQDGELAAKQSPEYIRDIYAPYTSIKNYLPSQYGTIDSVRWISTGYCGSLTSFNECDTPTIFGGDTYISRFTLKRKFPFFLNPMIDGNNALGHFTPFDYTRQRNVGYPRFYVDYHTDQSVEGRFIMPTIINNFNLDCEKTRRLYVIPPSKFYLHYYGIPSFLVESRINLNFRYGRNEWEGNFFPNASDYVEWTQEKNVGVRRDNEYHYNFNYSRDNDTYGYRILPFNYNKEEWDCRFDHKDRTIYSVPDSTDQDLLDTWTIFKANDYNDFGSKYGQFFGVKNIESEKVIGRFENGVVIFNAFNTIPGTVEDLQVGTGGVFKTRPTEFYRSDLGYGGTQHSAWVSSEFGHFWVDAKRGRIHQIDPNGGNLQDITLNGWKNWFRENLPFKIKKQIPTLPNHVLDNPYNGIGISMVWDDRFSRLFVTKKDYRIKDIDGCCIEYKEGVGFVNNLTKCNDNPQVNTCPEGYIYNEESDKCEKYISLELSGNTCEFDLVLVVDVSTSVDDPELNNLRAFLTDLLDNHLRSYIESGEVQVALVRFATQADLVQSFISGAGQTDVLLGHVSTLDNDLVTGGSTNINDGYCRAHLEIQANGRVGYSKKIMLLTDGIGMAGSLILGTIQTPCEPLFSINAASNYSQESFDNLRDDILAQGYESVVIGIEPDDIPQGTEEEVLERWNTIHTSTANNGEAFIAQSFTDLLSVGFVEEVFLSQCGDCPEGYTLNEEDGLCQITLLEDPILEDDVVPVDLDDDCFEECSWTVAYNPLMKTWVGHYDFHPNYYVGHTNYFQSGKNTLDNENGVWSHLLTNRSFQVFYGKKYPWIVELPIKQSFYNKLQRTVSYWLDVKRFHTEFDYAQNRDKGFTKAVVYNHDENSGMLNLIRAERNNLSQLRNYPKFNNSSIDILATQEHRKWTFNYIYNIVKDKYNNIPQWNFDCAKVHQTLNLKALDYRPTLKDNLRGDWFLVRLIQDEDSQHQYTFKWLTSQNDIYQR